MLNYTLKIHFHKTCKNITKLETIKQHTRYTFDMLLELRVHFRFWYTHTRAHVYMYIYHEFNNKTKIYEIFNNIINE